MVASDWAAADLGILIQNQLAHFKDLFGGRIRIEGPALQINSVAAQNIGMAIHELATNGSKYGALSSEGKVEILWTIAGQADEFRLEWRESGGPKVEAPNRKSFGTTITELAGASVSGASSTQYDPAGIVWSLVAPLENVVAR
jgi:two-component sensor histidine kinase